jgi:hypothetical protein
MNFKVTKSTSEHEGKVMRDGQDFTVNYLPKHMNDMYCHIIRTAYALCLGNPICNSICNGDKCCFDIFVGVGFFRGGRVAMLTEIYR